MELEIVGEVPAQNPATVYRGEQTGTLPGGAQVTITAGGQDILSTEVPQGKSWAVTLYLSIIETNV